MMYNNSLYLYRTIGTFVSQLLTTQQYYGTLLPRLPRAIQQNIQVQVLQVSEKAKRRQENIEQIHRITIGRHVQCMYTDDDHPPAMYDATISDILSDEKFTVTFPEYGNSEQVDIGDLELSLGKASSSSNVPLMDIVRQESRRDAQAKGTNYAIRPTSYKGSLTMKADRYTTRKRSRTPPRRYTTTRRSSRSRSPSRRHRRSSRSPPRRHRRSSSRSSERPRRSSSRERPTSSSVQLDALKQVYGDASKK